MVTSNSDLVADICAHLRRRSWILGTAESCSGGWLAKTITDNPGVSDVFAGGIITYSNALKTALLGISSDDLKRYGAVSRQTVEAMATGLNERLGTQVSVAISGLAGPSGGTAVKPVGLVYISTAIQGEVKSAENQFDGDRDRVRRESVRAALTLLLDQLSGITP